MRKISIKAKGSTGVDWNIFDEDAQKPMPEVQCFTMSMSIDDIATTGKIIWLDFANAVIDDIIPEIEETVEIVSIDVKR